MHLNCFLKEFTFLSGDLSKEMNTYINMMCLHVGANFFFCGSVLQFLFSSLYAVKMRCRQLRDLKLSFVFNLLFDNNLESTATKQQFI